MASIDIFDNDAFQLASMVAAIDKVPYNPSFLRNLNLCVAKPVTTKTVFLEERDGVLNLVQTSPRGAPLPQRKTEQRNARGYPTVRIAKGDRLNAEEIANVRDFGSETELMMMQKEVMRRMAGPTGLQAEIEMTWENMLLGMIQGIVLDADGSVIRNWYEEFNISQPTELAFDLTGANIASDSPNGALVLEPLIKSQIVRPMIRAAKGAFNTQTQIWALCGDTFYDTFKAHGDVARAYGNWMQNKPASDLGVFEVFYWGGIYWANYRGTDDNSTVAVNTNEAKFFPVNAPGVFVNAWSPGEGFDVVNQPGIPLLPRIIPDVTARQAFVDLELYSYPLHICTRPEVLLRARCGA